MAAVAIPPSSFARLGQVAELDVLVYVWNIDLDVPVCSILCRTLAYAA